MAEIVQEFPHGVRDLEHVWIPLSDGARLAARIWLPEDAHDRPVPAVVEYVPYRKRDGTRLRDEPMHRYFAGHGYGAVRIDLRGSGESDGALLDEYLPREQDDGVEALEWIARQPWCTGAVGMIGKSWGGFSALQIAARNPEPLKAVVSVCSTDDRYADDAHYMGGCLLNENLLWGTTLLAHAAWPPDPELVGDGWWETWLERLETIPLFPEIWLRHPARDDYWKHGSVCEDFSAVRCPVYAVGGWADGYTNAVPRLLAGLTCPRKGLVGPWAHVYPHQGVPGPAIGFLQECLRWWDAWLRGADTGILDEPMFRVWMQESVPPRDFYDVRPGRWVAEESWPSPRIGPRRIRLSDWRDDAGPLVHRSPQTVGLAAGAWCGFGLDGEMPTDQNEDDAGSLVFESEPLEERLEILGAPQVKLALAVDRPHGFLAARLSDVAPDGAATRVTYGLLHLGHRHGHERPRPFPAGEWGCLTLQLNDAAHSFSPGHRLRLSVSTSYWPVAWPSAQGLTLRVDPGESFLTLPVRPPRPQDADLRPFEQPRTAPLPEHADLHEGGVERSTSREGARGLVTHTVRLDLEDDGTPSLTRLEDIDLVTGHGVEEEFSIHPDDPLSARVRVLQRTLCRRGAWSVSTEVETWFRGDAEAFHLEARLVAREGDARVLERRWSRRLPRGWL